MKNYSAEGLEDPKKARLEILSFIDLRKNGWVFLVQL
jgi:hypothetical protein